MTIGNTYTGLVAIIGRPNVGKSTLLNHLIGQKLAITSKKPQTTRHRICGIDTVDKWQVIYVDTPGIHSTEKRAINRYMNKVAKNVIYDVDIIMFLVDRLYWQHEDQMILEVLKKAHCSVILILNKIDQCKDKSKLLGPLNDFSQKAAFADIVPISALHGTNIDKLQAIIRHLLPAGPFLFPPDQVSDRGDRFLVAEIIREKLIRATGEEIPYGLTVEIEQFTLEENLYHISALIYVERPGQKRILIGKGGEKLKTIGKKARLDIEDMLGKKVFLQLWVKVQKDWSDNETLLQRLGYNL